MLVRVIFSCRRSWRTHVWVLWNRAAFFPPSVIWKVSHPQASIMCLATGFTVTISSWHWNISCLFNLASFPSQMCFWVHNWKVYQSISLLEGAMNLTILVINTVIKARKFNTSAMKSFLQTIIESVNTEQWHIWQPSDFEAFLFCCCKLVQLIWMFRSYDLKHATYKLANESFINV